MPIIFYIEEAEYDVNIFVKNDKCQNDDESTTFGKSVNDKLQNKAAFSGNDIKEHKKYGSLRYV